jgi:hypothetical protein
MQKAKAVNFLTALAFFMAACSGTWVTNFDRWFSTGYDKWSLPNAFNILMMFTGLAMLTVYCFPK